MSTERSEQPSTGQVETAVVPDDLAGSVADAVADGDRFAGLTASARPDGRTVLRALLAGPGRLSRLETVLPAGRRDYRSVAARVPAATWYERELWDLFDLHPVGHPHLQALVFPRLEGDPAPRPGWRGRPVEELVPDRRALPARVSGEGLFTIPYGPVRSGVFETVEYLIETFGEDIPHLEPRVYHKHRGIDRRFEAVAAADGVLLAERVEGTASVAHAWAFSDALESLAEVSPPRPAQLVRLVHAELERAATHLDSVIRHCDGAAQAVALARMTVHKERLMRLRARLCGHRFGRGVVVPGGVSGPPGGDLRAESDNVRRLQRAVADDAEALMATPSFVDRLRGTGRLPAELAAAHGALGPVGRGSGVANDVRAERPYGPYAALGFVPSADGGGRHPAGEPAVGGHAGDALARQDVRLEEIDTSLDLAARGLAELASASSPSSGSAATGAGLHADQWRVPLELVDGIAIGSVEAAAGELLYLVEVDGGDLMRVKPRCPSFHNFALLRRVFSGDILTDFAFIEASFGVSMAGVAG